MLAPVNLCMCMQAALSPCCCCTQCCTGCTHASQAIAMLYRLYTSQSSHSAVVQCLKAASHSNLLHCTLLQVSSTPTEHRCVTPSHCGCTSSTTGSRVHWPGTKPHAQLHFICSCSCCTCTVLLQTRQTQRSRPAPTAILPVFVAHPANTATQPGQTLQHATLLSNHRKQSLHFTRQHVANSAPYQPLLPACAVAAQHLRSMQLHAALCSCAGSCMQPCRQLHAAVQATLQPAHNSTKKCITSTRIDSPKSAFLSEPARPVAAHQALPQQLRRHGHNVGQLSSSNAPRARALHAAT
jgi:hypothetical protein